MRVQRAGKAALRAHADGGFRQGKRAVRAVPHEPGDRKPYYEDGTTLNERRFDLIKYFPKASSRSRFVLPPDIIATGRHVQRYSMRKSAARGEVFGASGKVPFCYNPKKDAVMSKLSYSTTSADLPG